MNAKHPRPGTDAFEREWQLQERARRDERGELAGDPDIAAYRRVARALRQPQPDRLPSNFAYTVAALAERGLRAARLDTRLEQALVRALVAVMVLGALVVAVLFGRDWLAALDAFGTGASGWVATAVACVALTWGVEGLRRWRFSRQP